MSTYLTALRRACERATLDRSVQIFAGTNEKLIHDLLSPERVLALLEVASSAKYYARFSSIVPEATPAHRAWCDLKAALSSLTATSCIKRSGCDAPAYCQSAQRCTAADAKESPARWTQADIERIDRDAEMILSKMKPPPVADQESPAGSALIRDIEGVLARDARGLMPLMRTILKRARDRLSELEYTCYEHRQVDAVHLSRIDDLERELAEARGIAQANIARAEKAESALQSARTALREIYADICLNRDDPASSDEERGAFSEDICIVLNIARRLAHIELDETLAAERKETEG